jgi:hypothetical protein
MLQFCRAQVEAKLYTKAPSTPTSVMKLRDNENNRWELIAARTGLGVAAVKTAYEEAGGDATTSYTGRGRNYNGNGADTSTTKRAPAKRSTAKRGSAKRETTKRATVKRSTTKRSTTKRGAAAKRGSIKRNVASRRGSASNPS